MEMREVTNLVHIDAYDDLQLQATQDYGEGSTQLGPWERHNGHMPPLFRMVLTYASVYKFSLIQWCTQMYADVRYVYVSHRLYTFRARWHTQAYGGMR